MQAVETLKIYYEALANKNLELVADSYDAPSKLIMLSGVVNCETRDAVKAVFENIIKTWEQQDISSKIGYNEEEFSLTRVQENVVIVRNQLTNFHSNGNFHQTWECTYVMTKSDEKWRISLATTNNKASNFIHD